MQPSAPHGDRPGSRREKAPVITSLYSPAFFAVMSVVCLALFVVNVVSHGTALGLIGTGGLAVAMGYRAYQGWAARRRGDGR